MLAWVKEALAEHALQERIRTEVTDGLEKNQREFILRQQLATIRKELGELDEEGGEAADSPAAYRQKLAERDLPEAVRTAAEREVDKLERSSEQSPGSTPSSSCRGAPPRSTTWTSPTLEPCSTPTTPAWTR